MFKNKVVCITGASGGIGRGVAEMFVSEGAKVAISDLNLPQETASDIGAQAYQCDVSDESVCPQAFIKSDVEADHGANQTSMSLMRVWGQGMDDLWQAPVMRAGNRPRGR